MANLVSNHSLRIQNVSPRHRHRAHSQTTQNAKNANRMKEKQKKKHAQRSFKTGSFDFISRDPPKLQLVRLFHFSFFFFCFHTSFGWFASFFVSLQIFMRINSTDYYLWVVDVVQHTTSLHICVVWTFWAYAVRSLSCFCTTKMKKKYNLFIAEMPPNLLCANVY